MYVSILRLVLSKRKTPSQHVLYRQRPQAILENVYWASSARQLSHDIVSDYSESSSTLECQVRSFRLEVLDLWRFHDPWIQYLVLIHHEMRCHWDYTMLAALRLLAVSIASCERSVWFDPWWLMIPIKRKKRYTSHNKSKFTLDSKAKCLQLKRSSLGSIKCFLDHWGMDIKSHDPTIPNKLILFRVSWTI